MYDISFAQLKNKGVEGVDYLSQKFFNNEGVFLKGFDSKTPQIKIFYH